MKNALYLLTFIFLLTACSKEEAPASDPNSNNGDPNVPVLPLVSLISGRTGTTEIRMFLFFLS